MTKYEFTLVLKGDHELTEEMAEALYEAGCDDGTPGTCGGVAAIVFHRDAVSLEAAIWSAMTAVRKAGYQVDHVQIEADAVTPAFAAS